MSHVRKTGIAPPRLPEAPQEYSISYMSDLIRALEAFIEQERNPGGLTGEYNHCNQPTYQSYWLGSWFTME